MLAALSATGERVKTRMKNSTIQKNAPSLSASSSNCKSRLADTRRLRSASAASTTQALHWSFSCSSRSHRSGSLIPDASVLDLLPLADLVCTHTYVMLSWWSVCYLRALVLRAAAPSHTDNTRLRSSFATLLSLDSLVSRNIRKFPALDAHPLCVAIADCSLGSRVLNILLDCLTYDFDPTQSLGATINSLSYTISGDRIHFGGHGLLLSALNHLDMYLYLIY